MENESLLESTFNSEQLETIQTQIKGIEALFTAAGLLNWVVKSEKKGHVNYVVICNPEIVDKIEVIVKE